jgi:hypothetical protein
MQQQWHCFLSRATEDFETANRSKKDDLRFDDLMYVSYKNMAHFQDTWEQVNLD